MDILAQKKYYKNCYIYKVTSKNVVYHGLNYGIWYEIVVKRSDMYLLRFPYGYIYMPHSTTDSQTKIETTINRL